MAEIFVVSDLHLGHKRILEFTARVPGAYRGGSTVEGHDEWVIDRLMSVSPSKRDIWYVLGDVCLGDMGGLDMLDRVPGQKRLILGNHDKFATQDYLKHFTWVGGDLHKYGMWFTHIPIHPLELRNRPNVHGHCHEHSTLGDKRYFNCCIEWLPNNRPITLGELRSVFNINV